MKLLIRITPDLIEKAAVSAFRDNPGETLDDDFADAEDAYATKAIDALDQIEKGGELFIELNLATGESRTLRKVAKLETV